jgi:hypothetical protein
MLRTPQLKLQQAHCCGTLFGARSAAVTPAQLLRALLPKQCCGMQQWLLPLQTTLLASFVSITAIA